MTNPEQFLKVSIEGQTLGVPLDRVQSLLRADNVQYSPARQGPFGWLLSPEEIEIWQLHRLYGVEPPTQGGNPCVRLRGEVPRALLVDDLLGKIEILPECRFPILPMAMASREPLIAEIAIVDERAVPLLNIDALGAADTANVADTVWNSPLGDKSSAPDSETSTLGKALKQSRADGERALRILVAPEIALALPLSQIRAVSPTMTSVRLPASSDLVQGVVAWEGEVAYWVDWSRILGSERRFSPASSPRWVVAASLQGQLVVFPADSAMTVIDTDTPLEMVDTSHFPYSSVIPAAASFQDRLLVVPDLDALLTLPFAR